MINQKHIICLTLFVVVLQVSSAKGQFFGFKKNNYQTPISMTIFDLKAGIERFNYSSTEDLIGISSSKLATVYTLDFVKFNFTRYFWKQNMFDLQTGFSINYLTAFEFTSLPTDPGLSAEFKGIPDFSPRVFEFNMNETLNYAIGSKLLLYGQISYGYAKADLYRSREGSSYLSGSSNPLGIGLGMQLLIASDAASRIAVGFEFKYTDLRFTELDDPQGASIINEIDLSHFGATITFGMLFGGRTTSGDVAEKYYKMGKYSDARAEYVKFLKIHPNHASAGRARQQISESDKHIPGEMFETALDLQQDGNLDGALRLYTGIDQLNTWDFDLEKKVSEKRKEIAQQYFGNGLNSHAEWDFVNSERWFIRAEFIDTSLSDVVRIATSQMLLSKAERKLEADNIRAAEALLIRVLEMNPDLKPQVDVVYGKMARILFEDGVEALNRNAYIYAKASFEKAAIYNDKLRKNADLQIAYVEDAFAKEKISEAKRRHAEIVAQNKRHLADRLIAGVDKGKVLRLWGMPDYKYYAAEAPTKYELWVYHSAKSQYYYLYFAEDRLHSWETAEF
ncbi:MAG: hypothetical protein IIC40_03920 [Candidatus Marinimicrobia bacterium]|nr:hypothetical protein [Candidatus Neomarinimicrobiota bacterium]